MTTPAPTWLKVGLVCEYRMFWQCSEEFMYAVCKLPTGSEMLLGPIPTFSPYSVQPLTEFQVLESCQMVPLAAICSLCLRATATRSLATESALSPPARPHDHDLVSLVRS